MKGSIYITNNQQVVLNSAQNYSIICMSGETDNFKELIHATNASVASVLLPPYDAVMLELDGDINGFVNAYYNYLSNNEPAMFISLILRALYNGTNILLYLTDEESKLNYMPVFSKYMHDVFGIIIGTETYQFSYNSGYLSVIYDTLYMNELMTSKEYIQSYPVNITNINIATRLAIELGIFIPYGGDPIINVNNYKLALLNGDPIIPFRRV